MCMGQRIQKDIIMTIPQSLHLTMIIRQVRRERLALKAWVRFIESTAHAASLKYFDERSYEMLIVQIYRGAVINDFSIWGYAYVIYGSP